MALSLIPLAYIEGHGRYALFPLSCLLTIETLAAAICQADSIVGFKRGQGRDKITFYTDNTLMFLGGAGGSLSSPNVHY